MGECAIACALSPLSNRFLTHSNAIGHQAKFGCEVNEKLREVDHGPILTSAVVIRKGVVKVVIALAGS